MVSQWPSSGRQGHCVPEEGSLISARAPRRQPPHRVLSGYEAAPGAESRSWAGLQSSPQHLRLVESLRPRPLGHWRLTQVTVDFVYFIMLLGDKSNSTAHQSPAPSWFWGCEHGSSFRDGGSKWRCCELLHVEVHGTERALLTPASVAFHSITSAQHISLLRKISNKGLHLPSSQEIQLHFKRFYIF